MALALAANGMAQEIGKKVNPNGFNQFYYPSGKLSSEGHLQNGKPEGLWKNYYETGGLKSEGFRRNSELDSTWKFYSEEGILLEEITYQSGKRNGYTSIYSSEGFIESKVAYVADKKSGVALTYYTNGAVKSEVPYDGGMENGTAYEFSEQGEIIAIREFKNGVLLRQENINRRNAQGEKTGMWKEFYPDRKVRFEGRYKDNLKDGYWKEYGPKGDLIETLKYQNGQLVEDAEELTALNVEASYYDKDETGGVEGRLKFRGTYRNGVPHGTHLWFAVNGDIDSARVFKDGKLIAAGTQDKQGLKQGKWKEYYYPTGELKSEGNYADGYKSGEWTYYYQSGKLDERGAYDEKGAPHGKWKWYYESGQLLREEDFRHGKEHGWLVEYNDTGKVIVNGEFVDGREEGEWLYEVGDHKEVGVYQDGLKQGVWKHYYLSSGELRFEGEYYDDLPEGKHEWFFESGKRMLEGKYVSGIQEGEWRRYNEEGMIVIIIEYQSGKEVKVNGIRLKDPTDSSNEPEEAP